MPSNIINDLFDLQNKVAVITGGGGVLCSTMGKALAQAGTKIALLDIFPEAAQKVADEILASGGEAIAVQCDVLDRNSIEKAAKAVLDRFGCVNLLINGAGGNKKDATTGPDLSFFDLPSDAVQWVFNLNFSGTLLPARFLAS